MGKGGVFFYIDFQNVLIQFSYINLFLIRGSRFVIVIKFPFQRGVTWLASGPDTALENFDVMIHFHFPPFWSWGVFMPGYYSAFVTIWSFLSRPWCNVTPLYDCISMAVVPEVSASVQSNNLVTKYLNALPCVVVNVCMSEVFACRCDRCIPPSHSCVLSGKPIHTVWNCFIYLYL